MIKYLLLAVLLLTGCNQSPSQHQGTIFVVREKMRLELTLNGDPCSLFVVPGDAIVIMSEFKKIEKHQSDEEVIAMKGYDD